MNLKAISCIETSKEKTWKFLSDVSNIHLNPQTLTQHNYEVLDCVGFVK